MGGDRASGGGATRAALAGAALILAFSGPWAVATARADSQSVLTLGIGVEAGVMRYATESGEASETVTAELTVRLRLARFLGFAFAYNPIAIDGGQLGFGSAFRLTGILYLVPTRYVSIFVMGGLGARDIVDLGTVTGETNTYHAGGGLEVYLGDHFALTLEYLWLVPGYSRIVEAATPSDSSETVDIDLGGEAGTVAVPVPSTDVWDCFDAGNFQISLGVRYYI